MSIWRSNFSLFTFSLFTFHSSLLTLKDTLVIDSAQIAQWQTEPDFDYNRELVEGGTTFTQWLMDQFHELMRDIFGQAWSSDYTWWLLAAVGAVAVGIGIWYVWRFHPGLFGGQGKEQEAYEDTEDTIYGIDFDAVISQALGREDYREAIRMIYLRSLKSLSDSQQIDWQPFKTPSQYVRELSAACSLRSGGATANPTAFRALTTHFLRVRYGNFPATRALYDEVENLGKEVSRES